MIVLPLLALAGLVAVRSIGGPDAQPVPLDPSAQEADALARAPATGPVHLEGGVPSGGGAAARGPVRSEVSAPGPAPGEEASLASAADEHYQLRFRVATSDGTPIEWIHVRFGGSGWGRGADRVDRVDVQGRLKAVRPGSALEVWTSLESARVEGLGDRILAGERDIDLGELRLAPPVGNVWRGWVVWSDGRPVTSATVALLSRKPPPGEPDSGSSRGGADGWECSRSCSRQGEFALRHDEDLARTILVKAGPYGLCAEFGPFPPGTLSQPLVLPVDQAAIDLDLWVVDEAGAPVPGADGITVRAHERNWIDSFSADSKGRLVLEDLAGTTYLCFGYGPSTLPRSLSVREAAELGTIVLPTGHPLVLEYLSDQGRVVELEALDTEGASLGRISADFEDHSILITSDPRARSRVVVPRGTRTIVVLSRGGGREISRHPFPAEPAAMEWIRVPVED